jgi:hypothetical protein
MHEMQSLIDQKRNACLEKLNAWKSEGGLSEAVLLLRRESRKLEESVKRLMDYTEEEDCGMKEVDLTEMSGGGVGGYRLGGRVKQEDGDLEIYEKE